MGDASISQSNYKSCYFAEQVVRWATPRSVSRITKVVICRTSGEVGDALLRLNSLFNCVFYNMGDYIASEKVHVLYGTVEDRLTLVLDNSITCELYVMRNSMYT